MGLAHMYKEQSSNLLHSEFKVWASFSTLEEQFSQDFGIDFSSCLEEYHFQKKEKRPNRVQ